MIEEGTIHLILGPMFSGKSTYLIKMVQKYSYMNKKTILIKYKEENTIDSNTKGEIVTHEMEKFDALLCSELKERMNELEQYDIIGIDNGHFFIDLTMFCDQLCTKGKIVIVTALSGSFKINSNF